MKLFLDFLPLILFFITFQVADADSAQSARFASEHFGFLVASGAVGPDEAPVLLATLVVIAATFVQIAVMLALRKKIDTMLWVTLGLVTVLGGATVWLADPTFIKWKPTVLYWVMAVVFWASAAFFGKNLLQTLLRGQVDLPADAWRQLNLAWVAFFVLMGVVNIWVAYAFSTATWASFKVFGLTGLMLVFFVLQGFWLSKKLDAVDAQAAERAKTNPTEA